MRSLRKRKIQKKIGEPRTQEAALNCRVEQTFLSVPAPTGMSVPPAAGEMGRG